MKKILSLCMAVLMLCGLCTTAFAAGITESGNQSANTTVCYGVESSYVVTVPDTVSIDTDTLMSNIDVNITDVILPAGYQLSVTLTSDFTLTDVAHDVNTLDYEVKLNDAAIESGDVILTVDSGDTDGDSVTLTLSLTETPTTAGTYNDVMTFGVSVSTNIPTQQTVSGIWLINDDPTECTTFSEYVNFTSNSENFTYMSNDAVALRYNANRAYNYTVFEWTNDNYKIVDFGSTPQEVSQELYDWFTANATKQETSLISFTIKDEGHNNTKTYSAEDGMTWSEWVDSSYNTDNFNDDVDPWVKSYDGFTMQTASGTNVKNTDTIIADHVYVVPHAGGSND